MSAGQDSVIGKIIATILPPKSEGVSARVIALPPSLQTTTQGQTIEGEVVQQYKDGSLRVQTQQGALEILVRGNNAPKPGQTIQIDIPKGDPPRQVVVREAQPNIPQTPVITSAERHVANARLAAQHVQSQQQIPTLNQPVPRTDVPQTPVARQSAPTPQQAQGQQPVPSNPAATPPPSSPLPGKAAPLPEQILNLIRNAVPSSPQPPLEAGQTVRLTPVTPLQAQQILQQPQSNPVQVLATRLPEAIITRTSFEANLIAQSVQNANVQQVVQTPKDGIEQLVRLITGQQTQTQTVTSQNTAANTPVPATPQAAAALQQTTPPLTQLATFPQFPAGQQVQVQAQAFQPLQSLVTQIVTQGIAQQTVTQVQNFIQTQVQTSLPQIVFTPPSVTGTNAAPTGIQTNFILPAQAFQPSQIVSLLQVAGAPQVPVSGFSFPVQSIPNIPVPQVLTQPLAQSLTLPVAAQTNAVPAQAATQTHNAFIVSIQPPGVQITAPTQAATQNFTALLHQVQSPAFPIINGSPQGVPAIVAGTTPQNLPVVILRPPALPLAQSFILQTPAPNIQTGAQILIRPQAVQVLTQPSLPQTVAGQAPLQAQPLPLAQLLQPGPWPIMDELYQGLLRVSPQAAQALSQSVPNPGGTVSQLTPAALMFVAAVRSGDFASWLGGKTIDALQRIGKGNLPGRLGAEMASLNRGDAPVGEWRAVPLPMFWQGEIQKITLYTRQDRDAYGSDENDGQQTRFVFDLDLSRMGPVQLDGLIKGQRIDLIVRTELPFSEPMRQAMRQAYTDALYSTELAGELSFQGDTKHWVNVLQKDESFGANA